MELTEQFEKDATDSKNLPEKPGIDREGKTNRETYMTDVAATLATLPSGSVGTVIPELIK